MNNQPAFPVESDITQHQGMTLRDYFAGQALNGILTYSKTIKNDYSGDAEYVYKIADAMLAERAKND